MIRFVLATTWVLANRVPPAPANMFAQCPGATKIIRKRSISDSENIQFHHILQGNGRAMKMENERADSSEHVKPEFGSSGYFCIELFCGSGNLTFAMKHFFPDSFGGGS